MLPTFSQVEIEFRFPDYESSDWHVNLAHVNTVQGGASHDRNKLDLRRSDIHNAVCTTFALLKGAQTAVFARTNDTFRPITIPKLASKNWSLPKSLIYSPRHRLLLSGQLQPQLDLDSLYRLRHTSESSLINHALHV